MALGQGQEMALTFNTHIPTRFYEKPSKVGEKDKKEEEKFVVRAGLEPMTLRLQSAITPVKFYGGFFSKVNKVIYSSSPIT